MLTVACVWVKGPVAYTSDYVVRLERMVRRYLNRPFRFVCLTDQPWLFKAPIETMPVSGPPGSVPSNGAGYWTKVELFRPNRFTGRVLFLDLDVLVVAPLDEIVDAPAPFAITADALIEERAHIASDRYGRRLVRKFNSSVMAWDAGSYDFLWTSWTPHVAKALSTDQDWIGENVPDALALPYEWFPRVSRTLPPWPPEAKVVLCKKPKNHEAVRRWPQLESWWDGRGITSNEWMCNDGTA